MSSDRPGSGEGPVTLPCETNPLMSAPVTASLSKLPLYSAEETNSWAPSVPPLVHRIINFGW